MDLGFRLAESQTRASDPELAVKDIMAFNKMVTDAKAENVEIAFQKIDMQNAVVLAVGDSSFANVGKNKTASQAGLIVLLADNTGGVLEAGKKAKVTALTWRSHRVKRVVRSTLAAETMAALEAVENADLIRAHLTELHYDLGFRTHLDDVKSIPMIHLTDCKSLYDLLHKRGTIPSERRLVIDIEALRNDIEMNNVTSKWVHTKQMLADCMTKDDPRAADYLKCSLGTPAARCTVTIE